MTKRLIALLLLCSCMTTEDEAYIQEAHKRRVAMKDAPFICQTRVFPDGRHEPLNCFMEE